MASAIARTAIVTGAAQGIGRAIALRLANDGFNVVVNDIKQKEPKLADVAAEIQAKKHRAYVLTGDVSKKEDVQSLVAETVQHFGCLDLVR